MYDPEEVINSFDDEGLKIIVEGLLPLGALHFIYPLIV